MKYITIDVVFINYSKLLFKENVKTEAEKFVVVEIVTKQQSVIRD